MFYTKVCDGGLGVPSVSAQVHVMKCNRLNCLVSRAELNIDPVLKWSVEDSESLDIELKRSSIVKTAGHVVPNMEQFHDRQASHLLLV